MSQGNVCPVCGTAFKNSRSLYVHRQPPTTCPATGGPAVPIKPPKPLRYTKDMPVPNQNGVPSCLKCGGTQFSARRKTLTKVLWGVYSLAGTPHHVECEVCGARYRRPNV